MLGIGGADDRQAPDEEAEGEKMVEHPLLNPRFSKFVVVSPSACWIWGGSRIWNGYGRFRIGGKTHLAHRVAYEAARGEIPAGLTLDHLCRVRACVNPQHLEPVTMRENVMRGAGLAAQNAKHTACRNGHEYDDQTPRNRDGSRRCRICEKFNKTKQARRGK
jgi:hypothetical protein